MTDKTKAQLKQELQELKEQIKAQQMLSAPPAIIAELEKERKGDFRDKMNQRIDAVYHALQKTPQGATEDEFIALTIRVTGGITPETARKYIKILSDRGSTYLKVVDKGKWKKEIVTDADGNEQTRITRDGETTVDHGETVWQTGERIFAHPRAPPGSLSDKELKDL